MHQNKTSSVAYRKQILQNDSGWNRWALNMNKRKKERKSKIYFLFFISHILFSFFTWWNPILNFMLLLLSVFVPSLQVFRRSNGVAQKVNSHDFIRKNIAKRLCIHNLIYITRWYVATQFDVVELRNMKENHSWIICINFLGFSTFLKLSSLTLVLLFPLPFL